jgi:cytochrome P450
MASMNPDHILAAATHPDPYPYYAALVDGPPLVYDAPRKLWIASSAASVKAVLANADCHVRPAAEPVPAAIVGSAAGDVFGYLLRMNEGIRHQTPKLVLQRFLAGVDLGRLRQRTKAIAAAAISRRSPNGGAALTQLSLDIPVMAIADLLGFDEAELDQVAKWMGDFIACLSPLSNEAQLKGASDAASALLARLSTLVCSASSRPDSALAHIQCEATAAGWTDAHALLANLVGLLSQTYEATAGLIGNSIVALARQPGLRGKNQLLALVQEVSRHDPSIHNTRRFVVRATDACISAGSSGPRSSRFRPRPPPVSGTGAGLHHRRSGAGHAAGQ